MPEIVHSKINEIIDFWFEGVGDVQVINKNASPYNKWFKEDPKLDQIIKEKYEGDLVKAGRGEYREWENSAKGRLALILMFDQFARNMYRHKAGGYAYDHLAVKLALQSIEDGKDKELQLIERHFLYIPLMHSEDIKCQELSVKYYQELIDGCQKINPQNVSYYKYAFGFAKGHHDMVKRYGRFPYRNIALNRVSTPDELAFLKKNNAFRWNETKKK